ncbi:MAG: spore coat protein CotJB [Oscillospiraceae bacterium]|nr:spore coat protein CotJB [Oscillospiraceae bacterium]MCR5305551.1 spore coat protein CotJB [Oscillospiraceae bacterium]
MKMPQQSLDRMAKADLLRTVQEAGFSMHDLSLYLDTHPTDREALSAFRDCADCMQAACDAYAKRFGALRKEQVNAEDGWAAWSNTPWPWEKEAN